MKNNSLWEPGTKPSTANTKSADSTEERIEALVVTMMIVMTVAMPALIVNSVDCCNGDGGGKY